MSLCVSTNTFEEYINLYTRTSTKLVALDTSSEISERSHLLKQFWPVLPVNGSVQNVTFDRETEHGVVSYAFIFEFCLYSFDQLSSQ